MRAWTFLGMIAILQTLVVGQEQILFERELEAIGSEYGVTVGVAAKDMNTGESVFYHADSLFPTASVIKLPVLVELFNRFHDGRLSPLQPMMLHDSLRKPGSGVLQFLQSGQTLKLIDIATLMIILSDNTATNYVIDQFASDHEQKLEAVNSRMRSLGLEHTKLLNRLYSPETKKKTVEARRFGIGVSCPRDMVLLLEKLVKGDVIGPRASDSIIAIMRNQFYLEGAPRWLPFMEDTTLWVANKTGSLDDRKIDVGIVGSARGKYVYVIFCDRSKDLGEQMDNKATLAIAKISRRIYDRFMK